jgi:hypothetical protein
MTRRLDSAEPALRANLPEVTHLAEMIAVGRHPFPSDLTPGRSAELAGAVRQLRHGRLRRLVARAIAADLARSNPERAG